MNRKTGHGKERLLHRCSIFQKGSILESWANETLCSLDLQLHSQLCLTGAKSQIEKAERSFVNEIFTHFGSESPAKSCIFRCCGLQPRAASLTPCRCSPPMCLEFGFDSLAQCSWKKKWPYRWPGDIWNFATNRTLRLFMLLKRRYRRYRYMHSKFTQYTYMVNKTYITYLYVYVSLSLSIYIFYLGLQTSQSELTVEILNTKL